MGCWGIGVMGEDEVVPGFGFLGVIGFEVEACDIEGIFFVGGGAGEVLGVEVGFEGLGEFFIGLVGFGEGFPGGAVVGEVV